MRLENTIAITGALFILALILVMSIITIVKGLNKKR